VTELTDLDQDQLLAVRRSFCAQSLPTFAPPDMDGYVLHRVNNPKDRFCLDSSSGRDCGYLRAHCLGKIVARACSAKIAE
jgi:hypothetical protein